MANNMNHWYHPIVDSAGNIQAGCQVSIFIQATGAPAMGYDKEGVAMGTKPTFTNGVADIYLPGGVYKFVVTAPGYSETFYNEHVGNASGSDVGVVNYAGYTYTFEADTSAPPSTAAIRADAVDLTAATAFYIDNDALNGNDISALLLALGPASGNTKNQIRLTDPANGAQLTADITGVTDNTDYVSLAVSGNVGATSMSVGSVKLDFMLAGAKGADAVFTGDSGSGGTRGLVPAPASGDATKFLKGNGTWAAIPSTAYDPNVAALALEVSDLKGERLGMVNGFSDAYDSAAGLDDDFSVNHNYDATNDLFSPSVSGTAPTLLLHCEGSDTSTTITDSSPNAFSVTANGDAQIDTAQYKFGSSSALFDGTGDYLRVSSGTPLAFGTGDFTISFQVRFNSVAGNPYLIDGRVGEGAYILLYLTAYDKLNLWVDSADRITGTTTLTTGVWYTITLERYSGTTKLFVDTTQQGSSYTDGQNYISSGFDIGIHRDHSSAPFNGWIDEFAIFKGTAIYGGAAPTVPVAAWPDSATISDMVLISEPWDVGAIYNFGRLVQQIVANAAYTINTDVKGWISRVWATFTTDYSSDANQIDATAHGLSSDDRVFIGTSGTLPAGLSKGIAYYVVNATTNAFELSLTSGGAAIVLSDDGSGTHKWAAATEATLGQIINVTAYEMLADDGLDISGQPAGQVARTILQTLNGKDIDVSGAVLQVAQ